MKATCPTCSRQFNIPDDKIGEAGLKVRCPGCREISRFFQDGSIGDKKSTDAIETSKQPPSPAPTAPPEPVAKITAAPPKAKAKPEPPPRPAPRTEPDVNLEYKGDREETKTTVSKDLTSSIPPKAMAIIGGLGALIVILLLIIIFRLSEKTPEPAPPAVLVEKAVKSNNVQATEAFAKALENERLWTARGREDAAEQYGKALNLDPGRTETHPRLARLAIIDGMETGSAELIDKGCQDAENLSDDVKFMRSCRLAKGWCRLAKKDTKGALEQAQIITFITEPVDGAEPPSLSESEEAERDRKIAEGFVLAALSYKEKRAKVRMIESLKSALARDASNVRAHMELAEYYAAKKKWEDALKEAQTAVKISQNHEGAQNAVQVYSAKLKAGPEEKVLGGKSELSTLQQKKIKYKKHLRMAKSRRKGGDYNGAIGQLMKADKLLPGTSAVAQELGWVYLSTGSTQASIDSFSKAAKAGSAWAYYGLGAAYQAKGDKANAKTNYETFLKLKPNASAAQEVQSILNNL